jgi:PAS domain-containing protein
MAFYDGLMVAEIDTDGKLVNMSKRMVRFYGLNNESVDGLAYISVVAQDDAARESFKNFWEKLLTNGKGQRKMEANIHGKDTYAVEYYKVINKNDEPYRVIVIAVSKRRERELADRLASELQSYLQEHGMNSGEETKE